MNDVRAIKIAITAMGGQGGGVLAAWIVKSGERAGYLAQSTSVPGVAQRTGATVYYVELFPEVEAAQKGKTPVLALMPATGDVDIVIAAEFMETGRAIMRGFVSERTTVIASSHREYAIAEKIGLGDARQSVDKVRAAAQKSAGRFIEADMAEAAEQSGAVISAVLFGALSGSGALPISPSVFRKTITAGGRSVEANLRGFDEGVKLSTMPPQTMPLHPSSVATYDDTSNYAASLLEKMRLELPVETHSMVREGLNRCIDFQDPSYANEYLDNLSDIAAVDKMHGYGQKFGLTNIVAKHLALWMTYEDAIRVADLKTRASRFERFRDEVNAQEGQIVNVHEYLHPRAEEICDLLPVSVARSILKGTKRRKWLEVFLGNGRRVPTTKLRGFLQLWAISKLRFMRRGSFRFKVEHLRIRQWSAWIKQYAALNYDFACEVVAMQRLLKGYGDTHERGLANYDKIMNRIEEIAHQSNPALTLGALRDAALKDENGAALEAALTQLTPNIKAAQ